MLLASGSWSGRWRIHSPEQTCWLYSSYALLLLTWLNHFVPCADFTTWLFAFAKLLIHLLKVTGPTTALCGTSILTLPILNMDHLILLCSQLLSQFLLYDSIFSLMQDCLLSLTVSCEGLGQRPQSIIVTTILLTCPKNCSGLKRPDFPLQKPTWFVLSYHVNVDIYTE